MVFKKFYRPILGSGQQRIFAMFIGFTNLISGASPQLKKLK